MNKICFIAPKAYQLFNQKIESTFGGAEVQMSLLAKELAKNPDYKICFLVGDYGQKKVEKIEEVSIYKSLKMDKEVGFFGKVFRAIYFLILFNKVDCDFYVSTTANPLAGLVAFFCKIARKKHIHRTASKVDVDGTFIRNNGIFGKVYEYGIKNANLVFSQNEESKKMLKSRHGIHSIVIKNSFNIKKFTETPKRAFVLWVSRCHPLKKPEIFLDLATNFPDEKFVMVCPASLGFEDFHRKVKKRARNIKNVDFVSFVPFGEIQEGYYNKAKVVICTSDYEGFPNSFIHAGIGRVPILSLNVNPDGILNEYNCGFFSKGSVKKMKNQLEKLIKNRRIWEEKSENVFEYVKRNHDLNKNIEILKKIIKNLE